MNNYTLVERREPRYFDPSLFRLFEESRTRDRENVHLFRLVNWIVFLNFLFFSPGRFRHVDVWVTYLSVEANLIQRMVLKVSSGSRYIWSDCTLLQIYIVLIIPWDAALTYGLSPYEKRANVTKLDISRFICAPR